MRVRFYLELIGGIILIIFGILFLRYLPITISEITTDAIFIGAGVLIIRKSILNRRVQKVQEQMNKKTQKKPSSKAGTRKVRS
jgi:hypothetical protein